MTTVVAVKRLHRTKAGEKVDLPDAQARALVALGLAYYPPQLAKAAAAPKATVQVAPSTYMRRDLTAAQPSPVPPVAPKPADV